MAKKKMSGIKSKENTQVAGNNGKDIQYIAQMTAYKTIKDVFKRSSYELY